MPGASETTVGAAILGATDRLRAAGSPSPRLDAELLLAFSTDRDRSWVLAHPDNELDPAVAERFGAAVRRRESGEPIAYIRGFKEWYSLRIRTDHRALVPRPETEILVDAAIAEIERRLAENDDPIVAWEVATGTGAVTVAMARRFRTVVSLGRLRLIASDISADALELASENLAEHGVAGHVTLACADLLAPAGDSLPRPDVVIANLPYVATAEVDARVGSLGHEPRIALDGGGDGLVVLRRLVAELPSRATSRATVLLETGVDQAPDIATLLPAGWRLSVVPDLAGLERIARIDLSD